MSYTNSISLTLGSSKANLALGAQLYDTAGVQIGTIISTGFVEIGGGNYLWTCNQFPDNFRGGVKFFPLAEPNKILAATSINPEEIEDIAFIRDVIDELTNPPKEITVEVPHILTKGTTVDIIADKNMVDKQIQIKESTEYQSKNAIFSVTSGNDSSQTPIQIITGEGS